MTTTERVFQLIEENGFTAKEFANIVGLSSGNITDWKTGRAKPSLKSLKQISDLFNINIEWLLGENTKKEKTNYDNLLSIPTDFVNYIEDLPEYAIFVIKHITYSLLTSNNEYENIQEKINFEMFICCLPKRLTKDVKKAIIYLYNHNLKTIIKGKDDVILNELEKKALEAEKETLVLEKKMLLMENEFISKINSTNNYYKCPVYGQISAGQPNWAEECLVGYIPLDTSLMDIHSIEECFFLKVNGESMNKKIKNGSFALIHKQDIVEDGEIAVVLVNGYDATLKKFTRQGDLVILEPMSDDPSFTTQVYGKDTEIKILGKYIGKFEMNN